MKAILGRFFISIKWYQIKVLVFFFPFFSQAQLQQNDRIEIPLLRHESSFDVLPVREEGIVLYREIFKPAQGFQLIHLDTLFKQKWTGILPVDSRMQLAHAKEANKKSYFLFHRKDFSEVNFFLYEVNLATGNFTKYDVGNFIPFSPTHFEITKEGALIGGYFVGHVPIVLFFDFSILKSKVLPGLVNDSGELIQIKTNEDDSFNVLINSKNFSKQKTLWIKSYNTQGDLVQNSILDPQEKSSLLFGRIINLAKETQIIAGVYGNRNSDFSKGIFLARIDSGNNHKLLYYPFAEMQNFFKYMKAKREKRVVQRIGRKKINGKKIRLQYRFMVHEFAEHKDEFILLGEAFYPRYKPIDRNYGLGLVPGYHMMFDGYQYTHAVILGFNPSGKLLWDNSFEINDVKSFTLDQYVKMDVQDDKIALLYLFEDRIRSKIIQDNNVLEGKVYSQLNLQFGDDSEDDASISNLDYWYKDNFIAYGTLPISYARFSSAPKHAFYVNKLRYR